MRIFPIIPKHGKNHVLGDALLRALNAEKEAVVNDIEVPSIFIDDVRLMYGEDQLFGPIVRTTKNLLPEDAKGSFKLERMVVMLGMKENRPCYIEKHCMPLDSETTILQFTHD